MIIRKLFKFEGAHIVRNCSTERCKKSVHGHSYIVEVFLESKFVDNGQMVLDFGLMTDIRSIVDMFDHTYCLWVGENAAYKEFFKEQSDRCITLPVSPTAEMFSVFLYEMINRAICHKHQNNGFKNGEDVRLRLHSVRVHETATGYAEATEADVRTYESFRGNRDLGEFTVSPSMEAEYADILKVIKTRNHG